MEIGRHPAPDFEHDQLDTFGAFTARSLFNQLQCAETSDQSDFAQEADSPDALGQCLRICRMDQQDPKVPQRLAGADSPKRSMPLA